MATDSIPDTAESEGRWRGAELADVRNRLISELRTAWIRPKATPDRFEITAEQVAKLSKQALDAMLVRAFRVTPLPPQEEYDDLLSKVSHWVRQGKPIQIMLGYAPMKNPRTVSHTHADWAEFFALSHLAEWHNKVCA